MSAGCFSHLEVAGAWGDLQLNASRSQKPHLTGPAPDESILELQSLDAEETWHIGVVEAWRLVAAEVVVAVHIVGARGQLHLVGRRLLSSNSLNCSRMLERMLVAGPACSLA